MVYCLGLWSVYIHKEQIISISISFLQAIALFFPPFHHPPPILSKHPHHIIIPHSLPIHNHHPPSSPPLFPFPLSIPSSSPTPSTFSSIEFYQSNQIPVFPFLLIHIKMNLNTQRYLQLALLPLLLAILYPYYHKSSSQSLQSDIESKVCLIHSLHNLLLTLSTSTD